MRKGIGDLFFIGIVVMLFLMANVVLYIFIVFLASGTENVFFFAMKANERGGEMKSFLLAKEGGYFMESLGSQMAEGSNIDAVKGNMIKSLEFMGKSCATVYTGSDPDSPLHTIGACKDKKEPLQTAEIPLPGALKERLKANARLI